MSRRLGWAPLPRAGSTPLDFSPDLDRWHPLDEANRPAVSAWFAAHGVDANLVPLSGSVTLDPDTLEWRFEQYVRGEGGIRAAVGEPVTRVVRRKVKSFPPWVIDQLATQVRAGLEESAEVVP